MTTVRLAVGDGLRGNGAGMWLYRYEGLLSCCVAKQKSGSPKHVCPLNGIEVDTDLLPKTQNNEPLE